MLSSIKRRYVKTGVILDRIKNMFTRMKFSIEFKVTMLKIL